MLPVQKVIGRGARRRYAGLCSHDMFSLMFSRCMHRFMGLAAEMIRLTVTREHVLPTKMQPQDEASSSHRSRFCRTIARNIRA